MRSTKRKSADILNIALSILLLVLLGCDTKRRSSILSNSEFRAADLKATQISPHLIKVDSSGTYTPFPGVTVVAHIDKENENFWRRVYISLHKSHLISEYYSLLPASSYHMTTMSLYTERGKRKKAWTKFVMNRIPWFRKLNATLKANVFQPHGTLGEPLVTTAVVIEIHVSEEQKARISFVAKEVAFKMKMPEFHVTLGYLYKTIPKEAQMKIKKEIQHILDVEVGSSDGIVGFEEPKLTYFEDMTAFIPWDGETYPFRK